MIPPDEPGNFFSVSVLLLLVPAKPRVPELFRLMKPEILSPPVCRSFSFPQRAGAPAGERLQEGSCRPAEERGVVPDDGDLSSRLGGRVVQAGHHGRAGERGREGEGEGEREALRVMLVFGREKKRGDG